jgi:hypothetical protein
MIIDKLPAWLRHLLIAAAAVFGGVIVQDVITAGGVTTIDWLPALRDALDVTAVSTATIAAALWLTPLTRQYGIGSDAAYNVGVDVSAEADEGDPELDESLTDVDATEA